jgi:hypothetical protein
MPASKIRFCGVSMMRFVGSVGLVVGLTSVWSGAAHAQPFPFQETGRYGGMAILIRHEGVQAEIKITREQNLKLKQLADEIRKKHQTDFETLEKLEGEKRSQAKRELSKTIIQEMSQALPRALNADQIKRLKQISLQQAGLQGFIEPEVKKALKLTEEQNKALREIMKATEKDYLLVRQTRTEDFERAKKREHEIHRKALQKGVDLLTAEQNKTWKELIGSTFDFEKVPYIIRDGKPAETNPASPPPAGPPLVKVDVSDDISWVDPRVDEWQPTKDERKWDQIGWAKDLRQAIKLAKEHNRLVFIHAYNDGKLHLGRC